MTLNDILKIADKAYAYNCVSIVEAATGADVGDTLATFIAMELKDVSDLNAVPANTLTECARAMQRATEQLTDVANALVLAAAQNRGEPK